ncbi:MAG: glycosyltransferase family 4 protein [Balneolaceae bacterium]
MKVGFIAPLGIAAVNGGVRTQAQQTAIHLEKLGVEVQFISTWSDSLYVDLVHVFVAGPDTLGIIKRCTELGIKVVLSPVFFSNRSASTISTSLKVEKILSAIGSGIRSDFGIKAQACSLADKVLPNTNAEKELIHNGFGISTRKIEVVPNGVELRFAEATPDLFTDTYGIKDFVLFVGQSGAPRKNVIKLLEVAPSINSQVVIIGSFYDDEYGSRCKTLANKASNVTLIETLEHNSELLESAYATCHTFILPSLFETPGIAAMEAALTGANVVITNKGGTEDYFGNFAEYVSPSSLTSIKKGLNKSLAKGKQSSLAAHIKDSFSWEVVASKTLAVYKGLVD